MNKSELKKRLLDARELTTKHKGKMPLVIVCETQDEVNELNKIKKTMRNVKHIDIELTTIYQQLIFSYQQQSKCKH